MRGLIKRRVRDSNPRYLSAQWFSRPPHSTTLPTLHECAKIEKTFIIDNNYKNNSGILLE